MSELISRLAALKGNAPQLARILDGGSASYQCWLPEDLPDLLRHQWATPIDFDLATERRENSDEALTSAAESEIYTFGDLLRHSNPPLAVLQVAKDFFKDNAGRSKERHPEQQVAYLFYLLVILTAAVRLNAPISSLSENELQKGVDWSLRQTWLQGEPREILRQLASTFGKE